MPTYARDTTVTIDSSKQEIERTLTRYGAKSFLYGWEHGQAMIAFEIGDRKYKISCVMPTSNDAEFQITETGRMRKSKTVVNEAYTQAVRQRWRALALLIKATLEAAESNILALEIMLQPFTMLPNGMTVGEWMSDQIKLVYDSGKMPPLLPRGQEYEKN